MPSTPRNLSAALEVLDRAARTVTQAGNELRLAHIEIGNVPDMTSRLLDLYVEIDALHDRIRGFMTDARERACAS